MTKWYEREEGHTSAMRIIAMIGAVVGSVVAFAGLVGWFAGLPNAQAIVGAGLGTFAMGELAKSVQSHGEKGR